MKQRREGNRKEEKNKKYTIFALFFKSVITIEKQSERLRFLKNYKDLVTNISLQNYPVVLLLAGVR